MAEMGILNPTTVIAECLETAFRLKTYLEIMERVKREDVSAASPAASEFRTKFNGFYRVHARTCNWYILYYQLMQEQKSAPKSFKVLLEEMYMIEHTIEVSFVSKLIATVDKNFPIWDQYVIQNLNLKKEWDKVPPEKKDAKIDLASDIYCKILNWYEEFLKTGDGVGCINAFDSALPNYKDKLSNIKKIDYMLWSKR